MPTVEDQIREAADQYGMDPKIALDRLESLHQMYEISINLMLVGMERGADLNVDPGITLCCMYNLLKMQIRENMKMGSIDVDMIKATRAALDMFKSADVLERKIVSLNENGNLEEQ